VTKPIGPYFREDAAVRDWDPRTQDVARRVADLVSQRRPDVRVEHIGSTAVPNLPGKGVVDLAIEAPSAEIPGITAVLHELGFGPQSGPDPWPPTRPMLTGSLELDGTPYRLHLHVHPTGGDFSRDVTFRDALRADPSLVEGYAALKRRLTERGPVDGHVYTYGKTEWVQGVFRQLGLAAPPILPPATIGILGGGQLGRMLAMAARRLGYGVVVQDPDRDCPAAGVADEVIVGGYDDATAAGELADRSAVVTCELEHVGVDVLRQIDARLLPVRPGPYQVLLTQNRLEERAVLERIIAPVAPWRPVSSTTELRQAATDLGLPLRLKVAVGGYDGRGQLRLAASDEIEVALARLDAATGQTVLVERELDFAAELSVVVARGVDGETRAYPPARNVHDEGILAESIAPAPVGRDAVEAAQRLAARIATGIGMVGVMTVELFLLRDGSLVVNELAPRVHNSGHWSIEGAATSQFEQHVRAICGLPLGSTELRGAVATVNLLGTGERRPAVPSGLETALRGTGVAVHLYGKRTVFERRKMGHVTAIDPAGDADAALETARSAAGAIGWSHAPDVDAGVVEPPDAEAAPARARLTRVAR
jgi:5-(carboxyamino)imidazole ribonucleotide synthase